MPNVLSTLVLNLLASYKKHLKIDTNFLNVVSLFQISNFLFFLFPPVLIHLFQEYSKFFNPAINVLWVLLMLVGVSSAYFHATLSLVGK